MGKRISAQQFKNAVHVMVNGYCGCYTFKYDESGLLTRKGAEE